MEPNHHPKTTIDYAEWPRDAPSALERNIITIICGNSRLHWALHEGCLNKFIPIMFWHTAHDDLNNSNDEESYEEEEPCDLLEAHVASQAHTLIFGDSENRGCIHNVSEAAAKRDAPGISVFVVSSNPQMEKKICYMFRDVPAKIFKLRNEDFFGPEQGLYPTMGVDRAAALYGAKVHYGTPALVIDGGTAMTYSAIDDKGHIIGGGISPGVKVRLQSLAEYTGALPDIDHKTFKFLVDGAVSSQTPLPFFAKDTELAMFPIIITGGDGKFLYDLLQPDASGIVSLVGGAPPATHPTDVKMVKNLVSYALGSLIDEKYSAKRVNPEEKLRLKIQGLRIAAPAIDQHEIFTRGCVFHTTPEVLIEGYTFHARFDNGIQKNLSLRELFDFLVLYNEIGEKTRGPKDVDQDWVTEKKMWSSKVQEELGNVSRSIRNRMRELKPYIDQGMVHKIFRQRSIRKPPSTKKARRTLDNPQRYLNKRIAKSFPIDNGGGAPGSVSPDHQIFFGTVKYLTDSQLLWYFVRYDDGDGEDIDLDEVLDGIQLYEQHKHNDATVETPNGPKTTLPVGIKPCGVFLHNGPDAETVYTDLSTLLSMPATSVSGGADNQRQISEFKEDV
eukprot:jgi/Psemu1/291564/fgenesh1_pg.743_\